MNLAIEYDGVHFHKDTESRDYEKDELAKQNNITLFRIREKGLEKTNCYNYIYENTHNYSNIYIAINALIQYINDNYNKNIEYITNFDFKLMKQKVLNNLREQRIEKSLLGRYKEIAEYWDYENNEGYRPEDVLPSCKIKFQATCPYCKQNVKFTPNIIYNYYGKNSFTPHICRKADEYCFSLLEKKCKNEKICLSMEILEDRRLKDWLIRYASVGYSFISVGFEERVKKLGLEISYESLISNNIVNFSDLGRPFYFYLGR